MPALAYKTAPRGRCLSLAAAPSDLFAAEEPKVGVWDSFIPIWGEIVKFDVPNAFDEVTYRQMLDDLRRRNLCVYMDSNHATAWGMSVPALAYYCAIQVNHGGQIFDLVKLAGHSCCDKAPLDPGLHPDGLAGFRCRITPYGRDPKEGLANYQALSIHFDPKGNDEKGHEVGQVLICVSAVNGPHVPGAGPAAGQFSASRSAYQMADENTPNPEGGSMSPVMDELRQALGLPDGSSAEAILGAALTSVKAAGIQAEPDGDEPMSDSDVDAAFEEEAKDDTSMKKYEEGGDKEKKDPEMSKGFRRAFRRAVVRGAAFRRGVRLLAKEIGCKAGPKALNKAYLAQAATRSNAETKVTELSRKVADLEANRDAEKKDAETAKRNAWEFEIKTALNAAGPNNAHIFDGKVGDREILKRGGDGRISDEKGKQLFDTAKRLNASVEDVKSWLPAAELGTLTNNGSPHGLSRGATSSGQGSDGDRMVGGDQAAAIKRLRDQYQKETGKLLKYERAGAILQPQFARGKVSDFDYAAAKEQADRLGGDNFVQKAGK